MKPKGPVELTKAEMRLVPSGMQVVTGTENESGLWLLNGKPPPPQLAPSPAPSTAPSPDPPSFLHRHGKRMAMGGMALAVFIAGAATPMIMRHTPPTPPQTATSLPVAAEKSPPQSDIPGVALSSEGRQASRPTPTATLVDPTDQMHAWWSQSQSKPTIALPAISSAAPPPHRIRRPLKPVEVEAVYPSRAHRYFLDRRAAAPLPTDHCPDSVCLPWLRK